MADWRRGGAKSMRNEDSCSKMRKSMDSSVSRKISSAPVNVPDWSKIYGGKNSFSSYDDDDGGGGGDDGEMVPPHEWIARKISRNQISSFSVCEGIGRTLKGRDLSKVRNAVLTKTGFLE